MSLSFFFFFQRLGEELFFGFMRSAEKPGAAADDKNGSDDSNDDDKNEGRSALYAPEEAATPQLRPYYAHAKKKPLQCTHFFRLVFTANHVLL